MITIIINTRWQHEQKIISNLSCLKTLSLKYVCKCLSVWHPKQLRHSKTTNKINSGNSIKRDFYFAVHKVNYIWLMPSAKLSPNHCLNPRTLHKQMALLCALMFSWIQTFLSAQNFLQLSAQNSCKLKWTVPSCNEGQIILAWVAGPIGTAQL
jgi:hypothetical protein